MFADSDDEDDMFATARAALSAQDHAAATNGDVNAGSGQRADNPAEHAQPSTSQPPDRDPGRAAAASQPAVDVDYSSWPVKELKRFLTERGEVLPSSDQHSFMRSIVTHDGSISLRQ